MKSLIGKEYHDFDGARRWEILHEDMFLVILDTGVKRGADINLVGISSDDLIVKWELGGDIDSEYQYDGIVNVYVKDGFVWAGSWCGMHFKIDYKTGKVLEKVFRK